MARVFISHSSRDRESADLMRHWLQEQGFAAPFLDFDKHSGIPPGADWERTLYRELETSEAVLIIQTPNWLESKWCFAEFTQARALGKPIFPVIETPTGETLIARDIQALDLRLDREGGLARLGRELARIALDAQGGFAWDSSRPPYPGLMAFQEEDAAIYFGRDDDIRRLIERLNARRIQGGIRLIALLGASGSGKSSLLRAGVIPRLKRNPHNWIVAPPMRPQIYPVDELARAMAIAWGRPADWRGLRNILQGGDERNCVADWAEDVRMAAGAHEAQVLLAVDQAEELFSTADPGQARRFIQILAGISSAPIPAIGILAFRSDFLEALQRSELLAGRFEEFSLGPLPLARVPQIIEGPARVAGLDVDDGLVSEASRDAATEDALPLLAFALRELKDRHGNDNRLSLDDYRALGDLREGLSPLENAVRKAADEVIASSGADEVDLRALREAFIPALVRVNDAGEYVRRPAVWTELPLAAHQLLERLAAARLLVRRQEGEVSVVEVAHEALLRKWPRLRAWLDEERAFLIGRQQLEQDLRDWQTASDAEKVGALLSGLKLHRAESWLVERPQQLSADERAFIRASVERARADEQRRRRYRKWTVTASLAAALVLAVVTTVAILWLREAQEARARALDQQEQAELQKARAVSTLARQTTERGDAMTGMLATLAVLPENLAKPDRPLINAASAALLDAWLRNREKSDLLGHTGAVSSVAFSLDGKRLVTGSFDQTARVWDLSGAAPTAIVPAGDGGRVWSVAFDPDGKRAVTGSDDGMARVWDLSGPTLAAELKGHGGIVNSVAFSPDGKRVAIGSGDPTALVWDSLGTTAAAELNCRCHGGVWSVAFSPDGKRLVTGSDDGTARVWDLSGPTVAAELKGHHGGIRSVAFSRDGMRVVTGSYDNTARVWDLSEPTRLLTLLDGHRGTVASVVFSPDGERVATGSEDHTARVWDLSGPTPAATLLEGHRGWVTSVAFSPDGKRVVTGSSDSTARLWDLSGPIPAAIVLEVHLDEFGSVAFSPDGKRVVTGSADGTARLWDLSGVAPATTLLEGHGSGIWKLAFSPDGKRVVTGSSDGTARLWDLSGPNPAPTPLVGRYRGVWSVAFSPDGNRVAIGTADPTALVWDVSDLNRAPTPFKGHGGGVNTVAFSLDGKRVAIGSQDSTALVWDLSGGTPATPLEGHQQGVWSVAFSPNGKRVVTGSSDHTARVWDLSGPTPVSTPLEGHLGEIRSVAFSPDGKRVVTGSEDGTARVWDLSGPTPAATVLEGHLGPVRSVAFSPDGKRVVTGSKDGTARVWDTPPLEELIPLARGALTRCLTIAQRDELGLPVPPGAGQDRERIDKPPCP
jgi:WD40 repeat protein